MNEPNNIEDYNLLVRYMEDIRKNVKEDETTKRILFLAGISAFTTSPINLFLRGPSSIGKTYVTVQTMKYFPPKNTIYIGKLSPTAIAHDYGVLIDERTGEEFSEYDAPNKDDYKTLNDGKNIDHPAFTKAKKEWKEKLKNSFYAVNLENKILVFLEAPEYETFMMLRPILSHDVYEMSHKITGKTDGGGHRTKHIKIRGFPATVFCTTQLDYIEELSTRSLTHTPDMNPEKYTKAVQLIGEKSAFPWLYEEDDPETTALKERLALIIKSFGQHRRVVIPYGERLSRAYKAMMPRDMRDYTKLQDMIKASAILHMDVRPVIMVGDKPAIVATFTDLYNSASIFASIEESTRSGLSGYLIRLFYDIIFKDWVDSTFTIKTITDYRGIYRDMTGLNIGRSTFYGYLKSLQEVGWIEMEQNKDDKRRRNVLISKGSSEDNLFQSLVDFKTEFTPESMKEYISDLCRKVRYGDIFVSDNIENPDKYIIYEAGEESPPFVWGSEETDIFNECFRNMFSGLDLDSLKNYTVSNIELQAEKLKSTVKPKEPTPPEDNDKVKPLERDMKTFIDVLGDIVEEEQVDLIRKETVFARLKQDNGWNKNKSIRTMNMCLQNNDVYEMSELVGLQ